MKIVAALAGILIGALALTLSVKPERHAGRDPGGKFHFAASPLRTSLLMDYAEATRNVSGTYSLAALNPVVSGTTISSTWANNTMNDIATALTDSLDRNGNGGMLAALRGTDGTVAAPALSFTSDTDTGLYRIGANNPAMSAGNTKVQEWSTTGSTFPLTLGVTGATTLGVLAAGATTLSGALAMSLSGSGTTALASLLEGSLANGNSAQLFLGKAESANNSLGISYTPNATAASSTACFGVYGQNSVCSDGNNVVTTGSLKIGSSGSAITSSIRNTASWTPGSVGTNTCVATTITVTGAAAGADCVIASPTQNGINVELSCWTASNSCTIQACNVSPTNSVTPTSGTYGCRVFNP